MAPTRSLAPTRRAALLALLAALPLSALAADPPAGTLERVEGFSGMVKTGKGQYLVVHDIKSNKNNPRFGRLVVVKDGTYYQPLAVTDWKGEKSNDLEGVCRLPSGEFLAAESGMREEKGEGDAAPAARFGRIFRFAVSGDNVEILKAYQGAKLLISTKAGKGDDYEGLLCVPSGNKILIVQGERGGSKPYPHGVLRWGWLDLEKDELSFPEGGLAGLEVKTPTKDLPGTERRDIADLHAGKDGIIWAAGATDGGDSGPFRSYIYKLGKLQPEQNPPIALEANLAPVWIIDGFKTEALAEAWTDNGALAFGTEDEDIGGVIRELLKQP
jgi:hypothetical protein